MKRLLSIALSLIILVVLVSTGFAGEKLRIKNHGPAGPGERVQHVVINFNHFVPDDIQISPWPKPDSGVDLLNQPPTLYLFEELPDGIGRMCRVVRANSVKLTGDIEGDNPLLSDVLCPNSDFTATRVEAVGYLKGKLFDHEDIAMFGRMSLDIDPTAKPYPRMKGYWIFEEGVGTHYGFFQVEGEFIAPSGIGTYTGWVRKNR